LGDDLRLRTEDLPLIHEFFPDPASVFLLVQAGGIGTPTAGFFFWDSGEVFGDFSFMPFPFDATVLSRQGPQIPKTELALTRVDPAGLDVSAAGSRAAPLWRAGAVGAVAVGIAALLLSLVVYRVRSKFLSGADTVSKASAGQNALALAVTRSGSDVEISWNAGSPRVRDAEAGVLSIEDGGTRRRLRLTRRMLHDSRIVYAPTGPIINVELALFSASGVSTIENAILLLNRTSEPVEARTGVASRTENPPPRMTVPVAPGTQAKARASAGAPAVAEEHGPSKEAITAPLRVFIPNSAPPPAPAVLDRSVLAALPDAALPIAPLQRQPELTQAPTAAPPPQPAAAARFLIGVTPVSPVVPPHPIRQVRPQLQGNVKKMLTREVDIQVRVLVASSGRVTKAEPLGAKGAVEEYLGTAAAAAARAWKFEPARQDGRATAGEIVLQFRFAPRK
jgi:TonB family protein